MTAAARPCLVRGARIADAPAIVAMAAGLAAHHGETARLTERTLHRDAFDGDPWIFLLVAEADGTVAGFAAFCRLIHLPLARRGIEVTNLWTEPQARGRGIGTALLDGCIGRARDWGCDTVTVGAHPENLAAQAFYAARGFDRRASAAPRFRLALDRAGSPTPPGSP